MEVNGTSGGGVFVGVGPPSSTVGVSNLIAEDGIVVVLTINAEKDVIRPFLSVVVMIDVNCVVVTSLLVALR